MTALLGDGNTLFDDYESNGERFLTIESNVSFIYDYQCYTTYVQILIRRNCC